MVVEELQCHLLSLKLSASSFCPFNCCYRPRRHHYTTVYLAVPGHLDFVLPQLALHLSTLCLLGVGGM